MRIPVRMLAALLVGATLLATGPYPASAQTPRAETAATESRSLLRALEDAFVAVADRVTPAVVNVSVKARRTPSAPAASRPSRSVDFASSSARSSRSTWC